MDLAEFLARTQAEVRSEIGERLGTRDALYPYQESVFAEVVMEHMSTIGMTFDPCVCHYSANVGRATLRLSGYAISDDADQLDLFVSLYAGADTLTPISNKETNDAADQCLRFLARCVDGRLASSMDQSNDAYFLARTIHEGYERLDQIRIYVLTDRQAQAKKVFKPREVAGKTVKLEVMDIERLFRHWSEGKPRDELVVNFQEIAGGPLPCVYVPNDTTEYECALTVLPGEALRFLYEKYGARLLEANVRSFLSTSGKVNKGIRETLKTGPERFMAYNNGIVIVADEAHFGKAADGGPGIVWLKGMQIVNGGQTTATLYFAKKKDSEIDLRRVRVPAKLIVLRTSDAVAEEALISDISRFANSQNSVKLSDLSANKPFHVELEKLALSTYCPDSVGRWFYERAAGSYSVLLAREGTTPARLRKLKEAIPTSRRFTKTDLAKCLNSWGQLPHLVSLGSQKNFERFMLAMSGNGDQSAATLPDVTAFKRIVAQVILFRTAQRMVRPMFEAFQANVNTYLVSVVANRIGDALDLDRIWLQQDLSAQLKEQMRTWVPEVHKALHASAGEKMLSEWAKKPECWEAVRSAAYSPVIRGIPELRSGDARHQGSDRA